MIEEIQDTFTDKENIREVTFRYDTKTDVELLKKLKDFLNDNQSTCFNCKNYYKEGCIGEYQAACCRIHGCLEVVGHPHYDCDGSKCSDYKRK